ncbi:MULTISPECIES: SDR family oxidoreductase [Rhodomicrobium]|uniref:SDR family NAD(P)-dependent oxidoreductase n=1 Tax=Rhodomicrobium TaxID=1068 RepID=UPI000B4B1F74|nr:MULTISPECIES: SDR family oxidoreductase [Rhodomicrobium]
MGRLQDRVALITGAGGGLGMAMAKLFAAEGADVVLSDLNGEAIEAGAAEIAAAGGRASFVTGDVTKEDDVRAMIAAAARVSPKLHVLVNNAGNLLRSDFRHMDDATWESVLNPHLWGTIRMTRAALPLLTAAKGAAVVNLSSIMATQHLRQLSAYSTAKAAIAGLSRSLAVELAPYGIRVNYMCPGFIPTAMTGRYTDHPQVSKGLLAQMPMRRFGTPEEVAKVALFLASDDSAYTTGEGIMVDGGMSLNLV